MKEVLGFDEQIKALEEFRDIRHAYMQRVLALRDMHAEAGNVEAAGAAQSEYDRLIRNDDRLLDQIDALQERKVLASKLQVQE
jgi:hypothetical protein